MFLDTPILFSLAGPAININLLQIPKFWFVSGLTALDMQTSVQQQTVEFHSQQISIIQHSGINYSHYIMLLSPQTLFIPSTESLHPLPTSSYFP